MFSFMREYSLEALIDTLHLVRLGEDFCMKLVHRSLAVGMLLVAFLSGTTKEACGQEKENVEDVTVPTADGLRLIGQWYPGGQGKQSDCVVFVHAFQGNTQKGPWASAAKELQKKGFSVLTFDLRGHGKSTTGKTIHDAKQFANRDYFPLNRLSGTPNNADQIKGIDYKRFQPGYYAFMIQDLTAARRFLDVRNDAGECNSGRIHFIVDRDSASLALLFVAYEWLRNGINPTAPGLQAPNHNAGTDIASMVFLSPRIAPSQGVRNGAIKGAQDRDVYTGIQEKVAMAFVVNTDVPERNDFISSLFQLWKIKPGAKEDKELAKYVIEVKGAKNVGIDLLDEKLDTMSQIISFITNTKKKNTNGNDWKLRNATVIDQALIPLEKFNVR
jgi:pimeloyl-ACP methyl ester carboxylesterase